MACAGVSAGAVDFLHDDGGFGEGKASTAVFFGDEGGEPSGFGEGVDEAFGIAVDFIDTAKIFRRKMGAEFADGGADFVVIVGRQENSYAASMV